MQHGFHLKWCRAGASVTCIGIRATRTGDPRLLTEDDIARIQNDPEWRKNMGETAIEVVEIVATR